MKQMQNFPLESRGETVSREALVQAALQEITQNYREASLSNVARTYGVSLAYVSECVRAQTGKTYKELLQKHRMETAARLLRRDLGENDILAQSGDGFPRQNVVVIAAEQTAELFLPRHDQRHNLALLQIDLRVADIAEPLPGGQVDDFLVSQIGQTAFHGNPSAAFWYNLWRRAAVYEGKMFLRILPSAFFSRRDTCAWLIPISPATSIWVLPA